MSDFLDRQPPGTTPHAPQFGLASLILGAVVFIAAPVVLVLTTQLIGIGGSPTHAQIRVWLARIGVTGPFLITLFGGWLGIRGLQLHRTEGGSYALPAAGLVLCLISLLEWGVTCYALLWTVG